MNEISAVGYRSGFERGHSIGTKNIKVDWIRGILSGPQEGRIYSCGNGKNSDDEDREDGQQLRCLGGRYRPGGNSMMETVWSRQLMSLCRLAASLQPFSVSNVQKIR